ncbi:hypothetical protein GLOIN_2v1780318 [Rhizophagus irregularis DAOM 181602=DAOM 197198]|nr:hypothetical protein GLOIN_2v1780318 [Rhizophagus irregularis DAOM 181602=DAOM 197198]
MDTVDFFVLFDGQFHMFKQVEQLHLYSSFLNVPEVDSFIYSEKYQFNYTKPVATSFITVLNDALKCLAEYTSNIPSTILDTLQFIFDMDCREFDLKDNPKTLSFEAYLKQLSENLNEIYEILEKKQTEDFIEINGLLETQLEELNNKNDRETFKAVGYAIGTLSSIIATFNSVSWKKIAGVISGGIFGEKTLNKITNIQSYW